MEGRVGINGRRGSDEGIIMYCVVIVAYPLPHIVIVLYLSQMGWEEMGKGVIPLYPKFNNE